MQQRKKCAASRLQLLNAEANRQYENTPKIYENVGTFTFLAYFFSLFFKCHEKLLIFMGMQNKVAEIQGVFNFGPMGQNLFCKRVAGCA